MSERPGKRLVGWKEYLYTTIRRSILNAAAIGFGCGGIFFLRWVGVGIGRTLFHLTHLPANHLHQLASSLLLIGSCCGATFFTMAASGRMFGKVKAVPPVQLLTQANARYSLPEETLVRASDLPPTHQQIELLRAARPGQATPTEELLRATTYRAED